MRVPKGLYEAHSAYTGPFPTRRTMAKPNYSFEKRQREIAKKKKQDEKQAKKQAAKDVANPPPRTDGSASGG